MATPTHDDDEVPPPPPPPPIPPGGDFPDLLPGGPAAPTAVAVVASPAAPAARHYDGPDVAKSGTGETEGVVSPSASSCGGAGAGGWDRDYEDAAKLADADGGRPDDDDDDGPGSGSGRRALSRFVSTLCFVVGSCLYIAVAASDHRHAKHYRTLPDHVRTSDDDAVWVDYNLKKRFEEGRGGGGSGGARGLVAGGPGGLRRRAGARPARRPIHSRRLQGTPAEKWHDLDWSDLPPEVQSAYETLLTTEEVWCGESDGDPIDEYDWSDLDGEMREQAEFLGYTEETWCVDGETGEWTCLSGGPGGTGGGEEAAFETSALGEAETVVGEAGTAETAAEEASAEGASTEGASAEAPAAEEDAEMTAPDSQYHDMGWSEIPPPIKLAYEALGYNEELWDGGGSPPSADMGWDELSDDQRSAAAVLGYDRASWDGADGAAAADGGQAVPEATPSETTTKESPDAKYHEMEWSEIPRAIQLAYEALGYDEDYWCNGGDEPASSGTGWDELSDGQRFAAGMLGYNRESWDGGAGEEAGEEEADGSGKAWDELDPEYAENLSALGYDGETWDAGGTVPADDKDWDDLTFGERFWLTVLGFDEAGWDATPAGEHFAPLQPGAAGTDEPVPVAVAPAPVAAPEINVGPASAPADVDAGVEIDQAPVDAASPADPETAAEGEDKAAQIAAYDVSDWSDLPPDVKAAYETLGYDESAWCGDADEPPSNGKAWSQLSAEEQNAASVIGYTKQSWDGEESGTDSAVAAEDGAPDVGTAAPDSQYHDMGWSDIPPPIQLAYEALGYGQELWDGGGSPPSADMGWDELSDDQRSAAAVLGYDRPSWDGDGGPAAGDDTAAAAGSSAPPSTASEQEGGPSTASGEKNEAPDARYHDEEWDGLPAEIRAAYEALGYDEDYWCNGGDEPASDDKGWSELSDGERDAAKVLGYDRESWDGSEDEPSAAAATGNQTAVDPVEITPGFYDDYGFAELPPDVQEAAVKMGYTEEMWDVGADVFTNHLAWDDMSPELQVAAARFGYDKASWDADDPENPYVAYQSYDDDYLFPVNGDQESELWVSRYQILYFFAALMFVITGLLDTFRERSLFHVLMILAGVFGLLSAIFVEGDARTSNILNLVSVHFFMAESFYLFGAHKRAEVAAGDHLRCMMTAMVFGDLQFVLGAVLDVVLSYIWLFDAAAGWNTILTSVNVFAQVLWLNCSLIYMYAFFYNYRRRGGIDLTNRL